MGGSFMHTVPIALQFKSVQNTNIGNGVERIKRRRFPLDLESLAQLATLQMTSSSFPDDLSAKQHV